MITKLGPKQLLIITYFLTDNKWATAKELKEFFRDNVSNKTITTTLKLNNLQKEGAFSLFNVTLDERGKIYQLITEIDTFLLLAQNFLKSEHVSIFFESEYTQQFIKNKNIMKYIEKNLKIEYTKEARFGIHQIIKNSPTALYFGLFATDTLSQQRYNNDLDIDDESERELMENFISGLINDLKEQKYYLEPKVKDLLIEIKLHWNIKGKKSIDIPIDLPYTNKFI